MQTEDMQSSCDMMIQTQKQALMSNEGDDDAICKRTRARCTPLDDLEAFLQETDDEDDIYKVDDEEDEYRKFLATLVQSSDGVVVQDGDDDDKDLDFEIQLEETLETSDDEEGVRRGDNKSTKRRPVTRQKKRRPNTHKTISPSRLLRPILPILPIRLSATEAVAAYTPINGGCCFSEAQRRELHCLIHDHIQLLIQVYSLYALDHSRQHIGTQVHGLLSEMLQQQRPTHLLVSASTSSSSSSSVLDLAARYLVDVSSAVQDHRRCQVESGFDAWFERVPLFPLPHQEVTLVESGHKEKSGVDALLVHKDIAKLAKIFFPLFKVSLFPNKPPSTNRSLFTQAEDELLALGILEYNSDWKAIKQRFLPCKTEHQIHIRKKNRRSSTAPENPIKAVLRMKSSPLTPQEIVRIEEGFEHFKYDWMSVWKFIVPYRDPFSLPRQWRTALVIHKSCNLDPPFKKKKKKKPKNNENLVGDGMVDNSGEAYLHEGFLADWRPNLFYSTCTHDRLESCTRRLTPSLIMRPYRARKPYKKGVVRLAPDLPPVDLPPSVHVFSQSRFFKNQSDVSGRKNLGTEYPCFSADRDKNGPSSEKERNNDSHFEMHPLLFRTLEHGQMTCSSSFFSDSRAQLLSLFDSPRKINHSAEHEPALGDRCFHPLLQRREYDMSYLICRHGNLDPDIVKKAELCQLQDTSVSVDKTCIPGADRDDGSEVPGSNAPSDFYSTCIDEMADQSNLGIVMEKEELSNSDDEMMEEEHVEFECEEMTDSQGEDGSECEQMQDKIVVPVKKILNATDANESALEEPQECLNQSLSLEAEEEEGKEEEDEAEEGGTQT